MNYLTINKRNNNTYISFLKKVGGNFACFKKTPYLCTRLRAKRSGFSAVGSAHVWGARGRWFESSNPDQNKIQVTGFSSLDFFLYLWLTPFWRGSRA